MINDFKLSAVHETYLASWFDRGSKSGPNTSNQPSAQMPFQRWFKFKEAFAPSFVSDCINRLPARPISCLDPFGGSGTTALTCQFMGIHPTTAEVNPFMADVIEAKLTGYNIKKLEESYFHLERNILKQFEKISHPYLHTTPPSFVEPGINNRWIFSKDTARMIEAIKSTITKIDDTNIQRLFKVCLGGGLIESSNVIINGKGRRYRKNWQSRGINSTQTLNTFLDACSRSIVDIQSFRHKSHDYNLLRGDVRKLANKAEMVDFILTSPPYPNSFDYTDIYNVELWALDYLNSASSNKELRKQTLRSHVQVAHEAKANIELTRTLKSTYEKLDLQRPQLWNRNIPEMICHYFTDMQSVLKQCLEKLNSGGHMMLAVGDSRYQGVYIDVPKILVEIALELGFEIVSSEAVRSMRTSAQQGGQKELKESLLWIKKTR